MQCMNRNILLAFFILFLVSLVYSENVTEVKNIKSLALEVLYSLQNKVSVVSILPLQFALCKLASVAKGRVKNELLRTMGFTNENMFGTFYKNLREMLDISRRIELTAFTAIYLDYNDYINTSFAANSTLMYGISVQKVGLEYPKAAASFINREVSHATLKRIEDIVHPNYIPHNSSIVIVSAAHYKPTWEFHFDYKNTKNRKFYLLNNKVTLAPMMSTTKKLLYLDAKDFKVVSVHLICPGYRITFILPYYINMTRFLEMKRAEPDFMAKIMKQMQYTEMTLVIPRLKIKNSVDLTDHLKQIGLKEIFNSSSTDLNAILKEGVNASNMFLSKVKQKLFFELDEFGQTRIGPDSPNYIHSHDDPQGLMELVLDRPFYFTISVDLMDQSNPKTGFVEMFNGVVYEPQYTTK